MRINVQFLKLQKCCVGSGVAKIILNSMWVHARCCVCGCMWVLQQSCDVPKTHMIFKLVNQVRSPDRVLRANPVLATPRQLTVMY